MSKSVVLRGADCKLYLAGNLYSEVQNITYIIDYGEIEIFGVDSVNPQEIATTRITIQGTINGVRVRNSGGLQGSAARPYILESLYGPYISLRIKDRNSGEEIIYMPQIKVTREQMTIQAKGVVKLNFSFKAMIAYGPLDMN